MTSINPHFTIHYSQPAEYHFSHDSVFLARVAFEYVIKQGRHFNQVLDLCAGCGIVGIDYLFHLQKSGVPFPEQIDFLEVQNVYQMHFAQNIAQLSNLKSFRFLNQNYDQLTTEKHYDLILCNPPYFNPEIGKPSPSQFKNRCRFFIDSNFENLIGALQKALSPKGVAFVLLKDLSENGLRLEKELNRIHHNLKFTKLEKIRNTDLFQIQSAGH